MKEKKITEEQYNTISLKIPNEGTYPYRYFFRLYYKVFNDSYFNGVHMGNCVVSKGKFGFFLNFFEKIQEKKVSLFISNKLLDEYQYKNTLIDTLALHSKCKYLKAYFINPIYSFTTDNRCEIKILQLEHLVLNFGPTKILPN